eukprot:evm.model.NODE_49489_length_41668_cov_28.749687.1
MPAQEQWVWLTLGEVMGKVVVTSGEVFDPSAASASAALLPLTSLVQTGDVCEWESEEENTADDMDDKDEDEDDMPPTRRLAVLAAEDGTKKGSVVVVLQSCQTCDLLLGLADKAMIALGQWKQRKNYLAKLLALCNIILVAQISKDHHDLNATSASTTLTTQQQQQQQQQQQHHHPSSFALVVILLLFLADAGGGGGRQKT